MKLRVVSWAAVVPVAAMASILGWATAGASSTNVSIVDYAFSPGSITVPVGTTVVWTVTGMASHSVTSDSGAFDSSPGCVYGTGCLSPGASFAHTFTGAGTYTYHCRVHSTMHGTVTVTAAPPPTTSAPPTTAAPPPPTQPPTTTPAPGPGPSVTTMPHPPTSSPAAPPPTTVAPPGGAVTTTSPTSGPATTAGAGAGPATTGGGPSTTPPGAPTQLSATRAAHHGGVGLTGALIAVGVLLLVSAGGGLVVRSRGRP